MKKIKKSGLLFLFAVSATICFSQTDTITIPPTKIIIKTNLLGYAPNYAYNYGRANVGFEYYAGKDISVGVSGGTYYLYNIKEYSFKNWYQSDITTTGIFGGFFTIEFKRFLPQKDRRKIMPILFPLAFLEKKNSQAENTGYYFGLLLTEQFVNVFYDVNFGKSIIKKSANLFNISFDLTVGYQVILQSGWTFDQTFGIGITKGSIFNESVLEYHLFRNSATDFYPHLSYSIKFGKEFIRYFKLKEK
ncbi:MAG: hypothetical protein ACLGGV_04890 [Bacteroidia bacterium]